MILMKVINAMINEPNAIDPQCHHIPHLNDLQTLVVYGQSAISSPCPEKYHWQTVAAIMNYWTQMIKATHHKSPNKKNHIIYLVLSSHLIFANGDFGSNSGVPILYKKTAVTTQQAMNGTHTRYEVIGNHKTLMFPATNSDAHSMIEAPSEIFFQQQMIKQR